MSLIESKHAFAARCEELDASKELQRKLKAEGIETHRSLAFCIGTPQQPPSEASVKDICVRLFGRDPPTMGDVSLFRALHFESATLVVQSFKDLVSQGDLETSTSKKVPIPEKRARLSAQRARLGGLQIRGETEPSFALIDVCNGIYESGTMLYIAPERCTKRDDEISLGSKPSSQAIQVEGTVLKVGAEPLKQECDVGTELKLMWAFTRRAVAMDGCHLLSYEIQYDWVQRMMDVMAASAPPGYCKVTPQQVVRADQELWLLLAREVPFSALDARSSRYAILAPSSYKAMASVATEGQEGDYPRRPPKGRGKGRGNKGKPSTPRTPRNLPEAFKGMQTRTEKGNICFAFNTEGGCSNQTRKVPHGIRCDKGLHICIKCHREGHGLTSCRKS